VTSHLTETTRTSQAWVILIGVSLGTVLAFPVLRLPLLWTASVVVGYVAYRHQQYLIALLAVAFLIRLAALGINTQFEFVVVTGTTEGNHESAAAFARGLYDGEITLPERTRTAILSIFHAPFYLLLGDEYLVGGVSTAFFGTLIGVPTYYIASLVADERASLLATAAVVFWPSVVYRSLAIQREVFVVLMLFTLVYVAVRWVRRPQVRHLLLVVPVIWLLLHFRKENILFIGILAGLVIVTRGDFGLSELALLSIGSVTVIFFALNFGELTSYGTTITPEAIDSFAQQRAKGGAVYLENLRYRSWLDIVLLSPVKFVYYTFSPLPWQVRRMIDLLAGLSGWGVFAAFLLVPTALRRYASRRGKLIVLLGYAVSGLFLYGIMELNYGAAFRRRIAFVSVVVMVAALGISKVSVRYGSHSDDKSQATTEPTPE